MVVVRVRPILRQEADDIVRVLDNKMVVVLDPGDKYKLKGDVVGRLRGRSREKKYAFDYVFERIPAASYTSARRGSSSTAC